MTDADLREPVPSPILDSELKNNDESVILAGDSLENLSMTTQGETNMEMVTAVETNMLEEAESSIGATPCVATRTRSHDGQKPIPPLPKHRFDDLINNIRSEMKRAEEQNKRRDQIKAGNLDRTVEVVVEGEIENINMV